MDLQIYFAMEDISKCIFVWIHTVIEIFLKRDSRNFATFFRDSAMVNVTFIITCNRLNLGSYHIIRRYYYNVLYLSIIQCACSLYYMLLAYRFFPTIHFLLIINFTLIHVRYSLYIIFKHPHQAHICFSV